MANCLSRHTIRSADEPIETAELACDLADGHPGQHEAPYPNGWVWGPEEVSSMNTVTFGTCRWSDPPED